MEMTTTAEELLSSPEFLRKRYSEQIEYGVNYALSLHSRPDYLDVLDSSIVIGDMFADRYKSITGEEVWEVNAREFFDKLLNPPV
jgi:hypothetical protein